MSCDLLTKQGFVFSIEVFRVYPFDSIKEKDRERGGGGGGGGRLVEEIKKLDTYIILM